MPSSNTTINSGLFGVDCAWTPCRIGGLRPLLSRWKRNCHAVPRPLPSAGVLLHSGEVRWQVRREQAKPMTTATGEQRLTAPKNEERIREIRTNTSIEVRATIRSPQIRRWLLREFNFVTSQLFLLTNTSKARRTDTRKLGKYLKDLEFATELLVMDTEFYKGEVNEEVFKPETYVLRLISREATILYKQLVAADKAAAQLYMSEFKGELNREERDRLLQGVTSALVAIKQFSMEYVPKTAEEYAEELEIG